MPICHMFITISAVTFLLLRDVGFRDVTTFSVTGQVGPDTIALTSSGQEPRVETTSSKSRRAHIAMMTKSGKAPSNLCQKYTSEKAYSDRDTRAQVLFSNSTFGRFGNSLLWMSEMISISERLCCHLRLPSEALDGWSPGITTFSFDPESCNSPRDHHSIDGISKCEGVSAEQLFRQFEQGTKNLSSCPKEILGKYFDINDTHVLGEECPEKSYAVIHVRSGDISGGQYNSATGGYTPNDNVHPKYWLYPTSYYAAVVNHVRSHTANMAIQVLCEDMSNPSCDFLSKLSDIDNNIIMQSGGSLLHDLHILLCAQEAAFSNGSFKSVFELSRKLEVYHDFKPNMSSDGCPKHYCDPSTASNTHQCALWHFFTDSKESRTFKFSMSRWNNTVYQRHLVDKRYDMKSCMKNSPGNLLNNVEMTVSI